MRTPSTRGGWMLLGAGVAAAVAYSGFILAAVSPGDPDLTTVVSSLEAGDGSLARALRALDVVAAVLSLVLVPFVHWALPRGPWRAVAVWSFAIFAVAGIPAGVIALPCAEGETGCGAGGGDDLQTLLHNGLSILSTCALIASAAATALAVRREGPRWLARAGWLTVAVQVVTGGIVGAGRTHGARGAGRDQPAARDPRDLSLDRLPERLRRDRRGPERSAPARTARIAPRSLRARLPGPARTSRAA